MSLGSAGQKPCTTKMQGSSSPAQGSSSVRQGSISMAQRWSAVAQGSWLVAQGFSPAIAILALAVASACAPKVKYTPPTVEIAPAFRENADWKTAQPADDQLRGNWWELFGDADLNALEQQIEVSNQTLRAAEAQFAQARALVRGTRANLFPTVDVVPSATRGEASGNRLASSVHRAGNDFILPVDVNY